MHAPAPRPLRGRTAAVLLAVAGLLGAHVAAAAPAAYGSAPTSPGRLDPGLTVVGDAAQRVLVTARGGADVAADAVRALGGRVGTPLPLVGGVAATVPAQSLPALAASAGVVAVTQERSVRFTAAGTATAVPGASGFAAPDALAAAWSTGNRGQGVGIAVIDTGVSSVDGLGGRLVHGPDLSGEGTTTDSHGHGTVMAGVAAGSGTHSGVAPEATIVSVKVAGRSGAVDVSTMLQAMDWVSANADRHGIRVLNLSWGTQSTQDPAVDPVNAAVQRLWRQGIVVVVAAGNSGPHAETITKPADDPMVLTVGAYDDKGDTDDSNDTVPAWSSRGPTAAGVAKPDVVAPGRTLVSLRAPGSKIEADNPQALIGAAHIKGSGTSQAAAVVSGLSALVLAQHPSWTPDQVKRALTSTAVPLAGGAGPEQGAGRVRLAAALTATPGPAQWQSATAADPAPLLTGLDNEQWGSKWTGSKWTGSKWTGSKWTGSKWTGSKWTGSKWTGSKRTGSKWTGSKWTGSKWTGSKWTGSEWTGSKWTGSKWTGSKWTSADLTGDVTDSGEFLTGFWGQNPRAGLKVPGETSDAE